MFKSKFANALSTMMAGALGIAGVEDKLAVGYGAEAGAMTPALRDFVKKHCKPALVQCRNNPSREVLGRLGVRTTGGTDTAWTFDPAPRERGEELLRAQGWDGKQKIIVICPINPFWWPVKPDIGKAVAQGLVGQYKREHYRSFYYHHSSEDADLKYDTYLQGIADGLQRFLAEEDAFTILVGMERVDRQSAEALAERLDVKPPMFISDDYDMFDMVSVLRCCSAMISSRFHAVVTSMPGLVPSGGITMDERIRNLMNDRGHPELFVEVDEEQLDEKVYAMLRRLWDDGEQISEDIARVIPQQFKLMGQMGIDFMDEVQRVYPEFPRKDLGNDPLAHLPPLSPYLQGILETYG